MEKNQGCYLFFLMALSFWIWVIMAFVDASSCLGGLVGILVVSLFWSIFCKKKFIPRFSILFIFGTSVAVCINMLIGVAIWAAFLSAVSMVLNVVSILRFYYEARKRWLGGDFSPPFLCPIISVLLGAHFRTFYFYTLQNQEECCIIYAV